MSITTLSGAAADPTMEYSPRALEHLEGLGLGIDEPVSAHAERGVLAELVEAVSPTVLRAGRDELALLVFAEIRSRLRRPRRRPRYLGLFGHASTMKRGSTGSHCLSR